MLSKSLLEMWCGIRTKRKGVWHPYSQIKVNFETQRLNIPQFSVCRQKHPRMHTASQRVNHTGAQWRSNQTDIYYRELLYRLLAHTVSMCAYLGLLSWLPCNTSFTCYCVGKSKPDDEQQTSTNVIEAAALWSLFHQWELSTFQDSAVMQ